ncbi:MAG TPA: FHA domain-containing protein [Myxococcales bacterium]|nr:FHA domain-containing protein [Myxococcales bacterium]
MPPAAKPPQRKPPPTSVPPEEVPERTDPGGPSPEVLAAARNEAGGVQPGPGDATLVYDKNKGRARAPSGELPRLVVTAGPRKGSEFKLSEQLTTVGRGSDNVVVIPDISVSRQHVRLEKQGEGWVVHDQGSGNGTRVNGRQVEKLALKHGDEIEMGDTKVQFVEPGGVMVRNSRPAMPGVAAPEPEVTAGKAPPKSSLAKRAPLYGAILLALGIVFAAGMVRKAQRERIEAEAARQGDESRKLAQQRFEEGVSLLKQGRWVEARDKLKIAFELNGQDHEIARYLESAEAEAPRAQALQNAKNALARRDYGGVAGALAGIPDDSALAESARDVTQQMKQAMDGAVRDARAKAEAGDVDGAAELIDPVLLAEPSRADALAVRESITGQKKASSARKAERVAEARPARQAPPPPAADVQGILEAYLAGDIGAAIERAQAAQSPKGIRLLGDLRQFDTTYKDGLAKQKAGRLAEAVRALETASAADRTIASGQEGRLGREVRKTLAGLHVQLAAALTGDETLPQQAAHLRAAVQNDPGNEGAQSQLRQINDHAKEIYLRGYVAKDEDAQAARAAFKLVIDTLPSSDETAQKAKRWLDKLDGKAAKEE